MTVLIPLALVGFVAVWTWALYRRSGGRYWSPLWLAFSTTAVAALLIVAGTSGYTLGRSTRFVDGTGWSDAVIWWEVGAGAALLPLCWYFWRKGLRSGMPHSPRRA
jgi:hypothetical protein